MPGRPRVARDSFSLVLSCKEQRGLLTAGWKTNDSDKEAKYYRLTKAGRKALEEETEGWKRLRTAIDLILEGNLPRYEEV
jgi:DNA-binding PadR family transcriptional regulator